MKHVIPAAGLLAMIAVAFGIQTAHAQQMVPGPGASGMAGGAAPPARTEPRDIAPAALPGLGTQGVLATGPKIQKAVQGNPTTDLFTAVNKNDYAAAQDAISRGADLNAQNSLGESALDMAIALNENSITFMILSARNEAGGSPSAPPGAVNASVATAKTKPVLASSLAAAHPAAVHVQPAMPVAKPAPAATAGASGDAGQPNVSVGFLGFGQK